MFSRHFISQVAFLQEKMEDTSVYPFSLPVFQWLDVLDLDADVVFFVWENGTGKSTLLEAIAVQYGFNPEGGSKNFHFSTRDTHSILHECIRISKGITAPKDGYFFRSESYYNLASDIDDLAKESDILDSYGWVSLHRQSHGESFFSLFSHRFFGGGIYILDEPEAALSPQRQMAFLVRMKELIDQGSQFIIATHSPIILAYPGAKIINFSHHGIENTEYKKTDTYNLYELFINNPEYILRKLWIL